MQSMNNLTADDAPCSEKRLHVIGAGPVGLVMTAMLQSMEGFSIRLYEKRSAYTRTRMVRLSPYLTADSISAYSADEIDGESVAAIFEPSELEQSIEFRRSVSPKLLALLKEWNQGFCRLNDIEHGLSDLINEGGRSPVERIQGALTAEQAIAMLAPGDIMIDCTGANSLLRDRLVPTGESNTFKQRLEYAVVVTFLYGRPYMCNEYCKYFKNRENTQYKFVPAVGRIARDAGTTHVTGIVNISAEDYAAMPPKCNGSYLREHFPSVAQSMDRFIRMIHEETQGEVLSELDVVRIPLDLYRARNATSRQWHPSFRGASKDSENHPFSTASVFLVGDSAIGSPYFQSISLGFECSMFLADLLGQGLPPQSVYDRYEMLIYKQWLRVYMRSRTIKHNKDIFERLDDTFGVLERLHIY
jgi:hypothetical protein